MIDRSIYGGMLQEYNVARIRKMNLERDARLAGLRTLADAENYCLEVRSKIAGCFNMPDRRELPEVTVTGKVDLSDCRVEKIIYESRPGFPVTALLYLPLHLNAPAPAVLFVCGHSQIGKNEPAYAIAARTLAAQGYAVLAVDPISQGERYQFLDVQNSSGVSGACTREHNMLGRQMALCGEFFGTWRSHDALTGLDYLLSRPEVDPTRVGVTGNSGGGTMTTWVQALDPRFTMAAPSCYVTSWKRNIENEVPADCEQIPPGILEAGCEIGDFILAYAPRPIILLGQKKDFFDARGTMEVYEQCRRVYALLGAEDNIRCFIGPDKHGFTEPNRRSMYQFFGEFAHMPIPEKESQFAAGDAILCTPDGQVGKMAGVKSVHDCIVEKLDALASARRKLSGSELQKAVAMRLALPASVPVPYCRILRGSPHQHPTPRERIFTRFGLETDPGIMAIMKLSGVANEYYFPEVDEITLYIGHNDSADEMMNMAFSGAAAGLDVRGVGESLPLTCNREPDDGDFFQLYGCEYHYNSCSLMFGSSLLNDRIRDTMGAISFLKSNGVKKINLAGRGRGAVIAALTALLSADVASLTLFDAPESWDMMAREQVSWWPQSVMPHGILQVTDLPDIYGEISRRMPYKLVSRMDALLRTIIE